MLHGADTVLADVMLDAASAHTDHRVRRNEPYGPANGVAHTLDLHGTANGIPNVMLEIRNDLVSDAASQQRMAQVLAPWIAGAVEQAVKRSAA